MEEIRARGSANVARKEGRADHRETMRVQRRAGEPELGPIAEKALKELVVRRAAQEGGRAAQGEGHCAGCLSTHFYCVRTL